MKIQDNSCCYLKALFNKRALCSHYNSVLCIKLFKKMYIVCGSEHLCDRNFHILGLVCHMPESYMSVLKLPKLIIFSKGG